MTNLPPQTLESQALAAVHEEVLKLLALPLPKDIEPRIALIESICRNRHDLRTDEEKAS